MSACSPLMNPEEVPVERFTALVSAAMPFTYDNVLRFDLNERAIIGALNISAFFV